MRIAICDDSLREQRQLLDALQSDDPTREPECFMTGEALLAAAATGQPFEIVFLDIYMPGENGVAIAEKLKSISPATGIVFVTTSKEHAVEAFDIQALHYLVKPVTQAGVTEAMRRLAQCSQRKRALVVLPTSNGDYTLYLDEISYIQSLGHVKELILTDGRSIRVWLDFAQLAARLGETFLKLNRSVLVNMEQIEQMGTGACLLKSGVRLDFARRERAAIRAAYDNFLFQKLNEQKRGGGHEFLPAPLCGIFHTGDRRFDALPDSIHR